MLRVEMPPVVDTDVTNRWEGTLVLLSLPVPMHSCPTDEAAREANLRANANLPPLRNWQWATITLGLQFGQ